MFVSHPVPLNVAVHIPPVSVSPIKSRNPSPFQSIGNKLLFIQSKLDEGEPPTQFPWEEFHIETWPSFSSETTTVSFPEPQNLPIAKPPKFAFNVGGPPPPPPPPPNELLALTTHEAPKSNELFN